MLQPMCSACLVLVNRALYWVFRKNYSQWHLCVRTAVYKYLLDEGWAALTCFHQLFFICSFGPLRLTWGELFSFMPIQNDLRDERKEFWHLYFFHSELADFSLGTGGCGGGRWKLNQGFSMWKWFPAVAPFPLQGCVKAGKAGPRLGFGVGWGGSAKPGSLVSFHLHLQLTDGFAWS